MKKLIGEELDQRRRTGRKLVPGEVSLPTLSQANTSTLAAMISQFMYGVLRSGLSVRMG